MLHESSSSSSNKERDATRGYIRWKAFIERRAGQRSQQKKSESSLKESKNSGAGGFSLAKL